MRVAITADVHLTSQNKNPERYHALENILNQLLDLKIDHLIIAGDLCDASCQNPAEFEQFVQKKKFENLKLFVIPGNHDPALSAGAFTSSNLKYIVKNEFIALTSEVTFLFLPYAINSFIGESLAATKQHLKAREWVLIAHGDYLASTSRRNAYENGLYMPLSKRDIQLFKPKKVFLGHIHDPFDEEIVHYPGSPCGLDISETGVRSFLVYDTSANQVQRLPIKTDHIYIQESLVLLPLEDEVAYIQEILKKKILSWNLDENQKQAVKIRIIVKGYSMNRELVLRTITDILEQEKISLYELPDLSLLKSSSDTTREDIANQVQKRIQEMKFPQGLDEPSLDDYVLSALNQIYGAT